MGASISSGSVKYVFTQAISPSGEGEVEGSLWYDTATKILYTYDGSAWTKVATSDTWKLIERGSLGTNSPISITNIPTGYKFFKLVVIGRAASTPGYISLILNNATGVSAYRWTRWDVSTAGTAVTTTTSDTADDSMLLGKVEMNQWANFEILIGNKEGAYKTTSLMTMSALTSASYGTGAYLQHNDEITRIDLTVTSNTGFQTLTQYALFGVENE